MDWLALKMTPSLPSSRHTPERCPAPRYPSTAGAERAALGGGGELASLLVRVEHLLGDEAKKLRVGEPRQARLQRLRRASGWREWHEWHEWRPSAKKLRVGEPTQRSLGRRVRPREGAVLAPLGASVLPAS